MAGFENDVLLCLNVNFNPTSSKPHSGIITQDGQLLIGSAIPPNIRAGFLTGDSLITVNPSSGALTLTSSPSIAASFNTNSGIATPSAHQIKIVGGAGITTAGNLDTVTITSSVLLPLSPTNGGTGISNPTIHDLLIGNGSTAMTQLAPSVTSGVPLISQGASSDPAYGTAVVAGGGTGVTSFANTSAIVCTGTTTTGSLQNVASVATGQVLTSAGTSALPAWSATPTLTSVTFGSGTALSVYQEGTFTPTVVGESSAGSTSYTSQNGFYTKIGNLVTISTSIVITAATGTGNALFGAFPFTVKNSVGYLPGGAFLISASAWSWGTSQTAITAQANANATTGYGISMHSSGATTVLQMTNGAAQFRHNVSYQV